MSEDGDDGFDDDFFQEKVVKPTTPDIDEETLQGFDQRNQRIVSLIQSNPNLSLDLSEESKPIRDTLKVSYGVNYKEDVNEGG